MNRRTIIITVFVVTAMLGSASFSRSPLAKESISCILPLLSSAGVFLETLLPFRDAGMYEFWNAQPVDGGDGKGGQGSSDQSTSNNGHSLSYSSSNAGSTSSRPSQLTLSAVGGKGGDDDPDEEKPSDYDKRFSPCNDTPGPVEEQNGPDVKPSHFVHGLLSPPKQGLAESLSTTRNVPLGIPSSFVQLRHSEPNKMDVQSQLPCLANLSAFDQGQHSQEEVLHNDDSEDTVSFPEQENPIGISVQMKTVCSPSTSACVMPECMRHPQCYHAPENKAKLLLYPPCDKDKAAVKKKKRKYIPVNVEDVDVDMLVGLPVVEATDMVAEELQQFGFDPNDEFALALVVPGEDCMKYIPLDASTIVHLDCFKISAVHISRLYQDVKNKYIRKIRR
jgi:hypothetical protein